MKKQQSETEKLAGTINIFINAIAYFFVGYLFLMIIDWIFKKGVIENILMIAVIITTLYFVFRGRIK